MNKFFRIALTFVLSCLLLSAYVPAQRADVVKEQIDWERLFAERFAKMQSREDGLDMIQWMIEEHLMSCISVSQAAVPRFDIDKKKVVLEIQTTLNYDKYDVFVKRFAEVLRKMEGVKYEGKREFTIRRVESNLYLSNVRQLATSISSADRGAEPYSTQTANPMLYIGTSRWRALTQVGQENQVNFDGYGLPRDVFNEIRNNLILLRNRSIVIELLDGENNTVAVGKTQSCYPFGIGNLVNMPILFYPSLGSTRGSATQIWPGTLEHKEEIIRNPSTNRVF